MKMRKTLSTAMIAGAVATAIAGAAAARAETPPQTEKCYGVVKAGKNDCAAADKTHGCMGMATTDASGQEWISMPTGLCAKLAGGSLEPVSADGTVMTDAAKKDGE